MTDGGARSTSNFVNCADYLLSTDMLKPLPLKKGDHILVNFGLHDYNLGLSGVPEYSAEYKVGLGKLAKLADSTDAELTIVGTTPAHNTAKAAVDDATVDALNAAAQKLATEMGRAYVDLHAPLISKCGPVPWADNGTKACPLCAPKCKALSVHYAHAGYDVIATILRGKLLQSN
jgi:hypothetical protein